MWRKIALAGATTAVIVGAGGAALATSGTGSTVAGTPSARAAVAGAVGAAAERPGHPKHPGLRHAARGVLHGQFVTRSKDDGSTYVTHTVIRGEVTAVSAASISVKAADGFSQTFAVTGETEVHQRGGGQGTTVGIDTVKTGATVFVAGTGTDPVTATHVVVGEK